MDRLEAAQAAARVGFLPAPDWVRSLRGARKEYLDLVSFDPAVVREGNGGVVLGFGIAHTVTRIGRTGRPVSKDLARLRGLEEEHRAVFAYWSPEVGRWLKLDGEHLYPGAPSAREAFLETSKYNAYPPRYRAAY
jgi:hypothetical protein